MATFENLRQALLALSLEGGILRSGVSAPSGYYVPVDVLSSKNKRWPDEIIHNPEGGILPLRGAGRQRDYLPVPVAIVNEILNLD